MSIVSMPMSIVSMPIVSMPMTGVMTGVDSDLTMQTVGDPHPRCISLYHHKSHGCNCTQQADLLDTKLLTNDIIGGNTYSKSL